MTLTDSPFICARCGSNAAFLGPRKRSWNPNDKREGYCGACEDWTTIIESPFALKVRHRIVFEYNDYGYATLKCGVHWSSGYHNTQLSAALAAKQHFKDWVR